MDDAAADRALFGKGPHLGHQIVAYLVLDLERPGNAGIVDLPGVRAHIGGLLGADETEIGLCDSKGRPQPPPEQTFVAFTPDSAHAITAVAGGKGGFEAVMGHVAHYAWRNHALPRP